MTDTHARDTATRLVGELLDLPTFPQVAAKILAATQDESRSVQDVARLIERDQAVATKMLRVANSAMFGSRRQIRTVPHAAAMLGMENVRKYTLAIAVFGAAAMGDESLEEARRREWIHALAVAVTSRALGERLETGDPSSLVVAGLVHDAGKAALEVVRPGRYAQVVSRAKERRLDLLSAERTVYGTDHCLVGAEMARLWALPEDLEQVMASHHDTSVVESAQSGEIGTLHIVHLANFLCHTIGLGSHVDTPPIHADVAAWGALGIDVTNMVDLLGEVEAEVHGSLDDFDLGAVDLAEYCELADEVGEPAHGMALDTDPARQQLRRRIVDLSLVTDGVLSLGDEATAEEILTATAEGPLGQLDFDRILVYRVAADRAHLEPLASHGVRRSDEPPVISMVGDRDPLVAAALSGKPAKLRVGREFAPGDSELLDWLEPSSLAVVPLRVDGATSAVILVDNTPSWRTMAAEDMDLLVSIGKQLELALGRAAAYERLLRRTGQLQDMAWRDPLTGLHNRGYLEEALRREMATARDTGKPLSILMLDVDHFKSVNDTYGHKAGDEVLQAIARIARDRLRNLDLLCRYGGEEFTALLPGTPKVVGTVPAESVRRAVADASLAGVVPDAPDLRVTVSVGLATFPDDAQTAEDLIELADEALYKAKATGRNRVVAVGA
jgi:diguanylate cyclase (GGDEF)-like protein/putative nucleotidyltransferase with HDIG domain